MVTTPFALSCTTARTKSTTPWGNDPNASISIGYGLSSPDGDHWPLQLAWFDRLAERGVEIPDAYRDRGQWERRLWQEILIIDWRSPPRETTCHVQLPADGSAMV
jgi:hypothetical protein